MRFSTTITTTVGLAFAAAGVALAQGSSTGPGTGAAPPANGTPTYGTQDLDLPITQPPPAVVEYSIDPGMEVTRDPNARPPDSEDPSDEPGTDDPSDEPPPTFYGEEIESENDTIFYVIDSSGSMQWDNQSFVTADGQVANGSKMDRAKTELIRSITGLAPNFRFNMLTYDCNTQMWQSSLVPADDANKQAAIAWVQSLQAGGRTGTGPATALGLGDRENMAVVLLTDGAPNCGADGFEGHRTMISTNNTQGATINVFGIAASGDYRAFCQSVAGDSGGSYTDVP